jgi:glutathione-specific gamma-glutamylcyclotransferase
MAVPDFAQFTTPEDYVWGVAYRIEASKVNEVKEYLDIREINGYSIQYTDFHAADLGVPPIRCLVYIGMPDNPQFLGVQEPQALAEHIIRSKGPSGENREYLFMLDIALGALSPNSGDRHIHDLAERVRKILGASSDTPLAAAAQEVHRVTNSRSTGQDQQEETEKPTAS